MASRDLDYIGSALQPGRYDGSPVDGRGCVIRHRPTLSIAFGKHRRVWRQGEADAIDAQPEVYSVALLKDMKARAEADRGDAEQPSDAFFAAALLSKMRNLVITDNSGNIAINSPGAVQAGTVVFQTAKNQTKIAPPAGTIGADGDTPLHPDEP